jgi:hypothetical protein
MIAVGAIVKVRATSPHHHDLIGEVTWVEDREGRTYFGYRPTARARATRPGGVRFFDYGHGAAHDDVDRVEVLA